MIKSCAKYGTRFFRVSKNPPIVKKQANSRDFEGSLLLEEKVSKIFDF